MSLSKGNHVVKLNQSGEPIMDDSEVHVEYEVAALTSSFNGQYVPPLVGEALGMLDGDKAFVQYKDDPNLPLVDNEVYQLVLRMCVKCSTRHGEDTDYCPKCETAYLAARHY